MSVVGFDVYERGDGCCADRWSYCSIYVGDTSASIDPIANTPCYNFDYGYGPFFITCDAVIDGRYVVFFKPKEVDFADSWGTAAHLGEVYVYAS